MPVRKEALPPETCHLSSRDKIQNNFLWGYLRGIPLYVVITADLLFRSACCLRIFATSEVHIGAQTTNKCIFHAADATWRGNVLQAWAQI